MVRARMRNGLEGARFRSRRVILRRTKSFGVNSHLVNNMMNERVMMSSASSVDDGRRGGRGLRLGLGRRGLRNEIESSCDAVMNQFVRLGITAMGVVDFPADWKRRSGHGSVRGDLPKFVHAGRLVVKHGVSMAIIGHVGVILKKEGSFQGHRIGADYH